MSCLRDSHYGNIESTKKNGLLRPFRGNQALREGVARLARLCGRGSLLTIRFYWCFSR